MSEDPSPESTNIKSSDEVFTELKNYFQPPLESKVNIVQAKEEEIEDLDFKAAFDKEQLRRMQDENDARRWLKEPLLAVTIIWMFLVLLFVFGCGTGRMHLSDTVLITLITTTTANVFGFFYVVVNYLFNKDKST